MDPKKEIIHSFSATYPSSACCGSRLSTARQPLPLAPPGVSQDVSRLEAFCNLSSMFWVFLKVFSELNIPGKSQKKWIQIASSSDAQTQLAQAEEQLLYSELFVDVWAHPPLSKGEPSHPGNKTHFGCLYSWFTCFGHYPKFVTIGT